MKKIASNVPLQEMIHSVIHNATEKLAEDEAQKTRKLVAYEKKEHGHIPSVKEEEDEHEKTASADYVEKLASACDYISQNIDSIEFPPRSVLQKAAQEGSPAGAGKGPGALEVEKSIGGSQKYKKDKPATEDAAASQAGTPTHSSHPGDGKTQLKNNMEQAPGQSSGSVPKARYPEKGPLVAGPTKTATMRDLYIQALGGEEEVENELEDEEVLEDDQEKVAGRVGDAARAVGRGAKRYGELLRGGKKQPWATKGKGRAIGKVVDKRPGNAASGFANKGTRGEAAKSLAARAGTAGAAGAAGYAATKEKSAADAARQHILMKLAGEDVLKANISAKRNANPLAGKGDLTTTEASQASPRQAGDAGSGFGNQARKNIASNQAAINATKRDAKGPVKAQLSEVLDEPALSKKTDSKLQENLRNTGKAGVKIAAARAALQKIAQEGCQCEGNGECKYCQMQEAIKSREAEKTANAMMGYGGGGGAMLGGTPPPQMPTGGMSSMAQAGASADGCQCGGTGECRVCMLKAALAAAKAEAVGGAVEKDSMGDDPIPPVA